MTTSVFSASGLASGLDTASIVDKLVQLESRPISLLQKQQQGISTQVSTLGDIASRLSALEASAQDLGSAGVVGVKIASRPTSFSATAGSSAIPGDYAVQVTATAKVGKCRSAGFAAGDTVTGGTLHLTSQGTTWDIAVADGASLADVAQAIRDSGASVNVSILSSGSSTYLAIANKDSGYPISGTPDAGLSVTQDVTGTLGKALGLAQVQAADNAVFSVDGLSFTRTSNLVDDALPGATLSLTSAGGPAETLALAVDADATKTRLQGFVDAYNGVMGILQQQLTPAPKTDRGSTLAGDTAVRGLQMRLQSLLSATVPGLSTVRSLADLGLKSGQDGTLSVDATALSSALARDPGAVNAVFGQASTGLAAATTALVETYANPVDGILIGDRDGLNDRISSLTQEQTDLQARVDAYRAALTAQFAAMESVISQLKATGNFLTAQSNTTGSSSSG